MCSLAFRIHRLENARAPPALIQIQSYSRFHQMVVDLGTSKRTRRSGLCSV